MISSKNKISQREFKDFYNKGIKKSSKNFRISVLFEKNIEKSKWAVIVGKKVVKKAFLRNKNKRKIYKIIGQIYPQISNIKYCFLFLKRDITDIENSSLETELKTLLIEKK